MRQQRSTIITLTLLLLGVPAIALGQTPTSLTLNATSVGGGTPCLGTVTLSGPAASGGRIVRLLSDNPAVATVPDSVVVQAGQTTASFPVATVPVLQSVTVTIHAAPNGVNRTAQLTVGPAVPFSINLGSTRVTGAFTFAATVTLNGTAPSGGLVVQLSSSNSAVATVAASDTVPTNNIQTTFLVTALPVTQSTPVTISASAGGVTKTAQLTVVPSVPLSVNPSATSFTGGPAFTGTVTINGTAPSGGLVVQLSSSNPAAASVLASATVAAGTRSAGFAGVTVPVAQSTLVTITATANGGSKTAQLTVVPPVLSSFTLAPTSVTGGQSSTGQVSLNGKAPSGGLTIQLVSSNPLLVPVPPPVRVQAGQTTASFGVSTRPLGLLPSATVTITAIAGGVSRAAHLTVNP